jgi:hypothetical protein
MEQYLDYQTITVYSQLGVAMAGFGMVGSVLSSRRGSAHPTLDAFRLRVLVNGSGVLTLSGLLPLVLSNFSLPIPTVWRAASFIFSISLFVIMAVGFREVAEFSRDGKLASRAATIMLSILEISTLLILVVNLFYTGAHFLKGAYILALTIHTVAGFIIFARVFSSLFKIPPQS